jgi:hypothetical protein
LQQATGVEPGKDEHDAIDRLNQSAGLDRTDQLTNEITNPSPALEQALEHEPAVSLSLEMEVAEYTIEPVIEFLL